MGSLSLKQTGLSDTGLREQSAKKSKMEEAIRSFLAACQPPVLFNLLCGRTNRSTKEERFQTVNKWITEQCELIVLLATKLR